jgi:hypothetical protein
MSDRVMAGIASIPERADSLRRTLESIAPQVDHISLSLNDYTYWPDFLDNFDNLDATVRDTNGGDAEKFAGVDDWEGYVVTIDDDLLYPPDYVETLLAGIFRHGGDKIVGFHGGKTLGFNGAALAATHKQIRCLGSLDHDDVDVNVLGTGALAFDATKIPLWRDVFRSPNMADVYLACHARKFGIPMVALAHEAGWLQDICPPGGRRIYDSNRRRDRSSCDTTEQREREMGRFDWTAPAPARPRVRVSIATCARPHLLPDLLHDLERASRWADLEVGIYEDPSEFTYSDARQIALANGWRWHRFDRRLGREQHVQLVNRELADCRRSTADWFVFLPDDIRLIRHGIVRALDIWDRLDDPATLTLWRLKDHEGQPNWTGLLPAKRDHAWEVFHVDGIYLCRRELLEFLGYACPHIPLNRRRATSSGVGRAMSLHLHGAGKRMYRVDRSLAIPVKGEPSVMNPDTRDRRYPGIAL